MGCEKKTFLTKLEAVNRIAEIQAEEGENRKPIRSYRCEKCKNYHLTSWSKKQKKAIRNKKVIKTINLINAEAEYWKQKKGW